MFDIKSSNGFLTQLVIGITLCVLVLPAVTKSLSRGHLDLNGLALDVAETTLEAITQRDWNFGDADRVDDAWKNAE